MSTVSDPGAPHFDMPVPSQTTKARRPKPAERLAEPPKSGKRPLHRRGIVLATAALSVLVAAVAAPRIFEHLRKPDQHLIFHTVGRGSLPITVVERGNLESQSNVKVYCEVDDIHGDGIDGTPILWIVPNGASVKEGDLLVEFDSASHRERLDSQILDTEQAVAAQIQANVKHQNQISQNETAESQAELAVQLAALQLKMFTDVTKGSHKLEVDTIQRTIDDTENEILAARASLKLAENEKDGVEALFKLGYAGKSELDRTRLDYLQAQSALAAKINNLETQMATLQNKIDYERQMSLLQYEGDEKTAERDLKQVRLNNEAELAQAKAALDAADRALKTEQERLERYRSELANCKIYAPQDGMVAYATPSSRYSRSSTIAEGATVRERQHVLSLPNLSMMQVKTSVHESVQNQIREGLPASIRLDAAPDRTYQGSVKSIAVLPDEGSWYNSDTKMYKTFVTIDEEVEDLKPGMTAVVEIHVDEVEDALMVPIQAISQAKNSTFCYVQRDGKVARQEIEVGRTNEKFVEIISGLDQGDQVVLNPMAVVERQ